VYLQKLKGIEAEIEDDVDNTHNPFEFKENEEA